MQAGCLCSGKTIKEISTIKKRLIAAAILVIAVLGNSFPAFACTTILVGKDASADGCAYAGRTNDDPELAVTNRNQYSLPVRTPFKNLEDLFIQQVKQLPAPAESEADQALLKVNTAAWSTMNRVKTDLITRVSENTVLVTKQLGKD